MDESLTSGTYEIRLQGVLGDPALSAFPALSARADRGVTVLSGPLPDQAALFGVLDQVERLGLQLLGVHRLG
jgi:hypothetical protein